MPTHTSANDYIAALTAEAKVCPQPEKWITNKNTLEYLGTWARISDSAFNYPEFGVIENDAS